MPKIYLDVCCINRPFDNQTQDRIHIESEAVLLIISHFESGEWEWIGSEIVDWEIDENPDSVKRVRIKLLAQQIDHSVLLGSAEAERADELEKLGFDSFDALHLACAETGGADVFLTTDDRLLSLAILLAEKIAVRVVNPVDWLKEMTEK